MTKYNQELDFDEFEDQPPTIKEFEDEFNRCRKHFPEDGITAMHGGKTRVIVDCINSDDDYELIGMELACFSCRCEYGIVIKIKRT